MCQVLVSRQNPLSLNRKKNTLAKSGIWQFKKTEFFWNFLLYQVEKRNIFSERGNALHPLNSDEEEDGYDSPHSRRRGASVDEFLRGSELGRQVLYRTKPVRECASRSIGSITWHTEEHVQRIGCTADISTCRSGKLKCVLMIAAFFWMRSCYCANCFNITIAGMQFSFCYSSPPVCYATSPVKLIKSLYGINIFSFYHLEFGMSHLWT